MCDQSSGPQPTRYCFMMLPDIAPVQESTLQGLQSSTSLNYRPIQITTHIVLQGRNRRTCWSCLCTKIFATTAPWMIQGSCSPELQMRAIFSQSTYQVLSLQETIYHTYLRQIPVSATEPLVALRGPDPGSKLFAPTNKTLTVGPFDNNLHNAGRSLTRSSIGGC